MPALALDADEVAARAKALWPDLAAVADSRFEAWQYWAERLAGAVFGDSRLEAVAHLVAHAVVRSDTSLGGGGASPAGPLRSLSTLSLSASFGAASGGDGRGGAMGSDADLGATRPGQAYLALRAAVPAVNLPRVVC